MSQTCTKCYPRNDTKGEVRTVYGWYCNDCYEKDRDFLDGALRAQRIAQVEYYRKMSEMGARFASRTFENYRVSEANSAAFFASKKATEDRSGLYLYGPPGNGKTHLAAAIVNKITAELEPAIFTTSVGLVIKIRETYSNKGNVREGERDIIRQYAGARNLVLDDLGTEQFTPNTARLFFALINQRYENNLPLIVTSNVSLADLANQWAEAAVERHIATKLCDRIREMCGTFVRIDAKSERGVPA